MPKWAGFIYSVINPLCSFLIEKGKTAALRRVKKDVLAGISAKNDVINCAGIMYGGLRGMK
jgi:hypothetical protein